MLDDDEIRLPALLAELRDEGYETPGYRSFQEAARDGRFSATLRNGLWYGNRKNKHPIALAMRMKRLPPSRSRQRRSVTEAA